MSHVTLLLKKCLRLGFAAFVFVLAFVPGACEAQGSKPTDDAFAQLLSKAQAGDTLAQHDLAYRYKMGTGVPQDYAEAGKWYRKAAEQGDADSQLNLGMMYQNGFGVQKDQREAAKWYESAAEQGNAVAEFFLGGIYERGEGVTRDYQRAAQWYEKAADQGDTGSMFALGVMYEHGRGVPQDFTTAYMWFNLWQASDPKFSSPFLKMRSDRDELGKMMTPEQIAEGQRLTREWLAKHPK